MARPLSIDLRERAVAAVLEGGLSRHRVAARFGVAPSTVINWVRRFQATGSVAPGQMGGHKPKAIAGEHHVFLVQRIRDREFSLRGLVAELSERGSRSTIDRCGTLFTPRSSASKKTVIASERDRPDIARRRAQWMAQPLDLAMRATGPKESPASVCAAAAVSENAVAARVSAFPWPSAITARPTIRSPNGQSARSQPALRRNPPRVSSTNSSLRRPSRSEASGRWWERVQIRL
jgi:transposase